MWSRDYTDFSYLWHRRTKKTTVMAYKIKYGIFPNPQPDEKGNTTYQVRHTPEGTMNVLFLLQR